MICEECKQREARVFLTQIINGETIRLSLCEPCAAPLDGHIPNVGELDWASQAGCLSLAPNPSRPQDVTIPDPVPVRLLASSIQAEPFEIIRDLMYFNIFATVNTEVSFSTASELCSRYGITVSKVV